MPTWATLPLLIFGCTAVVPLFVLGATGGNWRRALQAWWQYVRLLLLLAAPAILIGMFTLPFMG